MTCRPEHVEGRTVAESLKNYIRLTDITNSKLGFSGSFDTTCWAKKGYGGTYGRQW